GENNGCDEAAVAAIKSVNWIPAKQKGNPVAVWVSVPVLFKLKSEKSETKAIDEKSTHQLPPLSADSAIYYVAYKESALQPIGGVEALQQNLVYPEIARRAGIEGTVIVHAQIGVNGEIVATKIIQSLGENNGCDEAAVAAIKSVKWPIHKAKDQPVSVWVSIPVKFNIREDQPNEKGLAVPSEHSDVIQKIEVQPLKYETPSLQPDDAAAFFVPYDKPPEPIGSFEKIQRNLVYPELAQKAGIEGQVTVFARIDEKGEVIDTKILVPLGQSGCNEAAVAAIKSVKWKPAQQRGKPVAVWVSVPVKFKLH
ncbi:energy transducer TonB, partial [candidate division KSB1 bacterium]|nr:energy transducer TonB [candidate division KSB1 bacterium]